MKIAVIGANGRTGKVFIATTLAAGHSVVAGVRNTDTLTRQPHLSVQHCDATNPADITALIDGCDALVSVIGHTKHGSNQVHVEATQALIAAIQSSAQLPIICLTGTGVRMPGDNITIMDRFLTLGVRLIDPTRLSDGRQGMRDLMKSNLNWTLLRVAKLTNSKRIPRYTLRQNGPAKTFVSRNEVAHALLELVETTTYRKQAPIVSRSA